MTTKIETLKGRIERVKLHLNCISLKIRKGQPIAFHVAGIRREIIESISI